MTEYENMDDFLEGTPQETEQEVVEEEAPIVETEGEKDPEPPTGEEDQPKEEEPQPEAQPTVEELVARANAFQRKAEDEVRKRQQIEAYIQQQQSQAQEEKPEFWDAPEEMIESKIQQVRQEIGQEFQSRLLNMSEASARSRHEDYQEKFEVFSQMVQRDPAIYQQMIQQPDPAEYAYRAAKRLVDIQSIGDIDSFKEQTRAEIRAEIEAEVKADFEKRLNQADNLPGSFSEKSSKVAPRGEWAGPTSLNSILG